MTERKPVVLLTDPIGGESTQIRSIVEAGGGRLICGTNDDWKNHLKDADAIIVNLAHIGDREIELATRCRVITRLGIGVDSVDVNCATRRGIWVTNVPHYCTSEVAEHTLALMLTLLRRINIAQADLASGLWNQLAYRGIHNARSTTVGVIGLGQLGREVAKLAASFGFKVIGSDPATNVNNLPDGVQKVDLNELLTKADIVTLHLPLVSRTRNLINADRLKQMRRGAFIVNTSRGGLIDEKALLDALDDGYLAGAGLDVFDEEPLSISSRLHGRPNLVLTPHISFLSEESLLSLQTQAAEDVLRTLSGKHPANPVNEAN